MQNEIHPVSRSALWLVAAITVFWALYAQLSNYNLDLYRDMVENHGLGIRWQWGGDKHPPMFGWLTAAWFAVLPRTDLSYRIFAALNIGVTLVLTLMVARRFLSPAMQQGLVLSALVSPLLGFQALTYNANAAMLPFWAAVLLFYLRVWEKRRLVDAVALGLLAGGAMLVKYYSAVLLIALLIHALSSMETRQVLFSRLGLASAALFLLTITPHLLWLIGNDFAPFRFAADGQGDDSVPAVLASQAEFAVAQIAYALPALAILGLLRTPGDGTPLLAIAQFRHLFFGAKGRVLLWSGPGAFIITMLLGFLVWAPLTSNWSMPAMVPLVILIVGLLPQDVAARNAWRVKWIAAFFIAVLLVAAPFIKDMQLQAARANAAVPIRALVHEANAIWLREAGTPLIYVTGNSTLAYGASFYLNERPQVIDNPRQIDAPWVKPEEIRQSGYMVICPNKDCGFARPLPGWRVQFLGEIDVAAPDGAGGPKGYKAFVWRALPDKVE